MLLSHFTETRVGIWEKLQDMDGRVFQAGVLCPQLPSDNTNTRTSLFPESQLSVFGHQLQTVV